MQTYTVAAGDTLTRIAQTFYGRANEYRRIADANRLIYPYVLRIGQRLTIPEDIDAEEQIASAEPPLPEPTSEPASGEVLAEVEVSASKFKPLLLVLAAIAVYLVFTEKR